MIDKARRSGTYIPYSANTAYINTIPPHLEEHSPGDPVLEERIRSYIRWNSMAMVVRANRGEGDLGGHIASYASVNTLMEVGFNHFWRAPSGDFGGDLIYIQGHCFARGVCACLFGRPPDRRTTEQLSSRCRRQGRDVVSAPETDAGVLAVSDGFDGARTHSRNLSSALSCSYLHARGIANTEGRKVWVFCGDGEMDEPESLGAIGLAAREKLDNLIFVVNCNLQRLDGPVRGNGKIIQELEGTFRGAGWNVIKVIWGSYWDPLLGARSRRPIVARDGRDRRRRVSELQGE